MAAPAYVGTTLSPRLGGNPDLQCECGVRVRWRVTPTGHRVAINDDGEVHAAVYPLMRKDRADSCAVCHGANLEIGPGYDVEHLKSRCLDCGCFTWRAVSVDAA